MSLIEAIAHMLENQSDITLFLKDNSFNSNEFIISKLVLLRQLYQQIYTIYSNNSTTTMNQFMLQIKQSLFENKNEKFTGFPSVFVTFYQTYKLLVQILPSNAIHNIREIRAMSILYALDVDVDLTSVVSKYDFYLHGYEKLSIPIKESINYAVALPDGRLFTSAYHSLDVWDLNDGTSYNCITNTQIQFAELFLMNNGNVIIKTNNTPYTWDFSEGELQEFQKPPAKITQLKISKNDKLIGGLDNGNVVVWDPTTLQIQFELDTNIGQHIPGMISLPNNQVVLWPRNNIFQLWDYGTETLLFTGTRSELNNFVTPDLREYLRLEMNSNSFGYETLPNGKILELGYDEDLVLDGQVIMQGIVYLDVFPNGDILTANGESIDIWDYRTLQLKMSQKVKVGGFDRIVTTKDGRFVIITNKTFSIWE